MSGGVNYKFSAEKNALLKKQRGIGFDDIIFLLENDCLLEIAHNKSSNHLNQEIIVIRINEYAYIVPFVRNGDEVFMKTIYPSRIMTEKHLKK